MDNYIDMVPKYKASAMDALHETLMAAKSFGPSRSGHEGYAIAQEEMDELWEAIRNKDRDHIRKEAVQTAAMLIRFIAELDEYELR